MVRGAGRLQLAEQPNELAAHGRLDETGQPHLLRLENQVKTLDLGVNLTSPPRPLESASKLASCELGCLAGSGRKGQHQPRLRTGQTAVGQGSEGFQGGRIVLVKQ